MRRDAQSRSVCIVKAVIAVMTCLLPSQPALADEVIMSTGDRLTGKVVRTDQSTLRLETDYAGTLSINWSKVQNVRFDEPRMMLLDDETKANGYPEAVCAAMHRRPRTRRKAESSAST